MVKMKFFYKVEIGFNSIQYMIIRIFFHKFISKYYSYFTIIMIKLLYIFISLYVAQFQPFYQADSQTYSTSSEYAASISFNGDSSIMALVVKDSGCDLYALDSSENFQFIQTIPTGSEVMKAIVTPDNQFLVVIAQDETRIYQYPYSQSIYQEITTIKEFHTGDISDDHQFLFFGQDNGAVIMYRYNGSQFVFTQQIKPSSDFVSSVDVSSDGLYMAFSTTQQSIYIYRYDGISYTSFQTLTFSASSERNIQFNQYNELVVANKDEQISSLFKYNEATLQFVEVTINGTSMHLSLVTKTTISDQIMIETTENHGLYVYRYDNDEQAIISQEHNLEQTLTQQTHRLSYDKKFLILAAWTKFLFYKNCNYNTVSRGYWSSGSSCQLCSQNCLYCSSATLCVQCDEENLYYLSTNRKCILNTSGTTNATQNSTCFIPNCVSCINDTHCSECDNQTSQMQLSNGRCCKWTDACHSLFWLLLVFPILSGVLVAGLAAVIVLKIKNASIETIVPEEVERQQTMAVMKEGNSRAEDTIIHSIQQNK